MTRPITLFTGQWADLPFEEVAGSPPSWGYDGLEIACWGDHLDVWRRDDDDYVAGQARRCSTKHNLKVLGDLQPPQGPGRLRRPDRPAAPATSCPTAIWGDGDPEGVRQRAAEEMKTPPARPRKLGVDTVVGFTGSSDLEVRRDVPAGRRRRWSTPATRTSPTAGTRSSTSSTRSACASPTRCTRSEIAYDYWTTVRTLEAIGHRRRSA